MAAGCSSPRWGSELKGVMVTTVTRAALGALVAVGLSACDTADRLDSMRTPAKWVDHDVRELPPLIEATRELSIDGYAEELTPLGGWPQLAVRADGTVAFGQPMEHTVRLFDDAGRALGRVGRQGEGPGEFAAVSTIGWLADTLWVFDTDLARLSLFFDGEFLRSVSLRDVASRQDLGSWRVLAMYSEDAFLLRGVLRNVDELGDGWIRTTPSREPWRIVGGLPPFGSTIGGLGIPYYPLQLHSVSPEGRWLALGRTTLADDSAVVSVIFTDLEGGEPEGYRYRFAPHPIPHEAIDSVLADRRRRLREQVAMGLPMSFDERDWDRVADAAPPTYPPVSRVILGPDGFAWLGLRHQQVEEMPVPTGHMAYLVTEGGGRPSGLVSLPGTVLAIGEQTAWTVVRDSVGVQSLFRFRLSGDD